MSPSYKIKKRGYVTLLYILYLLYISYSTTKNPLLLNPHTPYSPPFPLYSSPFSSSDARGEIFRCEKCEKGVILRHLMLLACLYGPCRYLRLAFDSPLIQALSAFSAALCVIVSPFLLLGYSTQVLYCYSLFLSRPVYVLGEITHNYF